MAPVTRRRSVLMKETEVQEEEKKKTSIYPQLDDSEVQEESEDNEESTHSVPLNHSFAAGDLSFDPVHTSEEAASAFPYLGLLFVFFVILIGVLLGAPLPAGREPTRAEFGALLATVIKAYPTFSARDRAQLRSAADRWYDASTSDPVVVVIYASGSSAALLDDLTTTTSGLLAHPATVVTSSPGTARAALHATFESALKGGARSTIGLREAEKLPWDAPLVLHSFADADHVAASRPLLWLQVTRDDSLRGKSCDAAIESTLTSSWLAAGGNEDNVAPVIARILQFTVCLDW